MPKEIYKRLKAMGTQIRIDRFYSRPLRFSMKIFILAVMLPCISSAASLRKVTRSGGDKGYDAAINLNFDRINYELFNVMHKTKTETIRGEKTFVDTVTFGAVSATSLSMSGNIDMNSNKITELANGTASTDAAAFGQIPVAATQSDQETGTSLTTFVSPGRQQYHTSSSKAWVVFQGTGTVTIKGSYGVSSVGDNGNGDYTINFTTSFSSANYACVCTASVAPGGQQLFCDQTAGGQAAGSWRINTHSGAAILDCERVHVICFGDQ